MRRSVSGRGRVAALACAAWLHVAIAQTSAPSSEAVSLGQRFHALQRPRGERLADRDAALRTAIEFVIAVGNGDGGRAGKLIDTVGYQVLPRAGPLPERPSKPVPADAIRKWLEGRRRVNVSAMPATLLRLGGRELAREFFPPVATWMLPDDFIAVVLPDSGAQAWIAEPACVVVRVRAGRAVVLGGTLIEQLGGTGTP